jgi:hypothetical protein
MASILPSGRQSYQDNIGRPLDGFQLYTYAAGTNVQKATYKDALATVTQTNPIIGDVRGEAVIFWDGAYDVVLRDKLGNLIWEAKGLQSAGSGGVGGGGAGGTGENGISAYTATIYRQAATVPTAPSGGSYNFSTATLTPPPGWTVDQPASSTTPTYSCKYNFTTQTPGVALTAGTWLNVVLHAQLGGSGTSFYTGTVYQQSATAPPAPTGGSFNFLTGALIAPAGWLVQQPSSTSTPTYVAEYQFRTQDATATVVGNIWSAPVIDAVLGGSSGLSVFTLEAFLQDANPPLAPTGGSYNFTTRVFIPPAGWLADQPASTTVPTYRTAFTFQTTTPSTTVNGATWGTPRIVARNGDPGTPGAPSVAIFTDANVAGPVATNGPAEATIISKSFTPPSSGSVRLTVQCQADGFGNTSNFLRRGLILGALNSSVSVTNGTLNIRFGLGNYVFSRVFDVQPGLPTTYSALAQNQSGDGTNYTDINLAIEFMPNSVRV